jgi:gliding motility-associated-like protein
MPNHSKQNSLIMCKKAILLSITLFALSYFATAQKPTVLSVDKRNGSMGEVVTLKGSDFGVDPSKIKVFFGAAAGDINNISNQLVEVNVPPGATFDNISASNTTNGLTGYSPADFLLKFSGDHGLTPANFGPETSFNAESGLYDLCLCDFNGDHKVDIGTASDNSNSVAFFQNNSSAFGTITLARVNSLINARSLHSTCGDLNGDGKPDMVVSEGQDGDRIFIFRNTGNFTFAASFVRVVGRKVKRVAIADLDLNGKPELVVTDKGSSVISILPNQSTLTSIAFGTPTNVTIPGIASTDGLELKDINGNGQPEIIVSQFLTDPGAIFICDNKSSPGIFNFNDITTLPAVNSVVNIKVGDLDGDQKPDIAATRLLGSDISIYRNQSTASQISFGSPVSIFTSTRPWGLDFGDLDGDGKNDIVVGSINTKTITVLNNKSISGSLSFEPMITLTTTFINRHVKVGDLDGDGKPDIAFTSIDDNNLGIPASKISVFRNQSCFKPVLLPEGPITICSGVELYLTSNQGGGVAYDWVRDGTTIVTAGNHLLDVGSTGSGAYQVVARSEGANCTKTSNIVNVTVAPPGAGLNATPPDTRSNSPVCTDNTLNLIVNDVGADEYRWRGPNGYTATGRTPSFDDFTIEKAGLYIVEMLAGSCIAKIDSTIVEAISNPDFSITFPGTAMICQGTPKILSVSPVLTSGFTYQWFESSLGALSGQTNNTFGTSTSGAFFARVTSIHPGCAPVETASVTLIEVAVPDAAFTPSASSGCVGQEITFTNQSVVDPNATATYTWTFGDNKTSTETNPKNTYTQAATYSAKLRVTYQGESCPNEETKSITIVNAPSIGITNPQNRYALCPGDTLRLIVTGDTFSAYSWNTGATAPFIIVDEASEYSVNVTNSAGCVMHATRAITSIPAPEVIALARPEEIEAGQNSFLTATGLQTYRWSPGVALSDSTIANPVATPLQNITYTVTGVDENGCKGEASVDIVVFGSSALNLITPKNFFSPNDDNINQFWTIDDIESFPQCGVAIYNDKGAKVFEARPYTNNWDGTFKGSKLPGGVYYYVIKCEGEVKAKTGSITLLK